ncbi:ATP-binding cassette domain-containing protein, partial [Serratia bockelmannii]
MPIYKGQVLFILGANGAGKSSLIYHVLRNL